MTGSTQNSAEKGPKRRAPLKIARFRHAVLTLAAATILLCGGVLLGAAVENRLAWLAALSKGPPPFKALGDGALSETGTVGEVALRAQIDSPRAYYVAMGRAEAFAAPLYPPEADQPSDPVTTVLLEPAGAPAEKDFANWVQSVGPTSVVVQFLGRRAAPDEATREHVAEALAAEGLRLAPDAEFIDPHHRPRRIELAPPSFGLGLGASVIGLGALTGLFTLGSLERSRRRRARLAKKESPKNEAAVKEPGGKKAAEQTKATAADAPEKTPAPDAPAEIAPAAPLVLTAPLGSAAAPSNEAAGPAVATTVTGVSGAGDDPTSAAQESATAELDVELTPLGDAAAAAPRPDGSKT